MIRLCPNLTSAISNALRRLRSVITFASFLLLGSAGYAAQVTIAWNPNAEPDVTGYQVKYGNASGAYTATIDVGKVTTATISNLAAGGTFYIAVTSYNAAGFESRPSNEVRYLTPVNQPPLVTLTSPANDIVFDSDAGTTLAAVASDADGSIARVEFYAGGALVGTVTEKPYSLPWTPIESGTYRFMARAIDNSGAATESAVVTALVAGTRPSIGEAKRMSTGGFKFTVTGPANRYYTVQVSSDLTHWSNMDTIMAMSNSFEIVDADAATASSRFYRIKIE